MVFRYEAANQAKPTQFVQILAAKLSLRDWSLAERVRNQEGREPARSIETALQNFVRIRFMRSLSGWSEREAEAFDFVLCAVSVWSFERFPRCFNSRQLRNGPNRHL